MMATSGQYNSRKRFTATPGSKLNIRIIEHNMPAQRDTKLTRHKIRQKAVFCSRNTGRTVVRISDIMPASGCDLKLVRMRRPYKWWNFPSIAPTTEYESSSFHKRSNSLFKNVLIKKALECIT